MGSVIHLNNNKGKFEHERWTSPWKVGAVLELGLNVEVQMGGRKAAIRRVLMDMIKPSQVKPPDLHHPIIACEFAEYIGGADVGLSNPSNVVTSLNTVVDL